MSAAEEDRDRRVTVWPLSVHGGVSRTAPPQGRESAVNGDGHSYNCKYASDSHVMVTVLGAGVTIWEPRPDDLLAGVLLKLSTKGP